MRSPVRQLVFFLLLLACPAFSDAQEGPSLWVFGKNAGLDFNGGPATGVSYSINNCYSPSASQADEAGNLLFYCDGRDIRDRDGQVMPGSLNPVWQPVHMASKIVPLIVPVPGDTNRYYVFMLTPSSGIPPFGTYYSGVLSYSIVDMRLNNGKGGVDPAFSNTILNTELDTDIIIAPGNDCNYWLIAYRKAPGSPSSFLAYSISAGGIADPVSSTVTLQNFPYTFNNMEMIYAYRYHKIVAWLGGLILFMMDFDPENGIVSNAKLLQDLVEFRSAGGGVTTPALCFSRNEQQLYMLGYPGVGTGPGGPEMKLYQYAIDLTDTSLSLPPGSASTIFQTNNAMYMVPSTSVPYASMTCDIRRGPDGKVYLFYNTAQSFLGVVNKPDLAGAACDFVSQGLSLLPNTYGSYFFPTVNAERFRTDTRYRSHDTLLCFSSPLLLKPPYRGEGYDYQWSDGSTQAQKEVTDAGTYWVRSTRGCNADTEIDTFVVRFEPPEKCNCNIFIPNAFSPNQDNLNDVFRPILPLTCMDGGYRMMIFNRWGEKVFQSYDVLKGWDGTVKGRPADLGVYYYTIRYSDRKGAEQSYKGDFSLIR